MSNLVKLSKGGSVLLAILFSISTASASQVYDNNTGTYTDDFSDNVGIPTRTKVNVNSGIIQLQNATNTTFNTPYSATGEVLTSAVIPTSVAKWGTVTVNANVPASTTVRMQVYINDQDGGVKAYPDTLLSGNSTGFDIVNGNQTIDISQLAPLATLSVLYPEYSYFGAANKPPALKIKILMSTTDPLYTPTVDSLVVTWSPKQGDLASTTLNISDWQTAYTNLKNTLHLSFSNESVYPAFEWASNKLDNCGTPRPSAIYNSQLISSVACMYGTGNMYAIDMNTGTFNWSLPYTTTVGTAFTIGANGTSYQTDNADVLSAIDLNNRNVKWTHNFISGHGNDDVFIGQDGMLYTIRMNNLTTAYMNAFTPDGNLAWTSLINDASPNQIFPSSFAQGDDGTIYFTERINGNPATGKLFAFNLNTRSILWTYTIPDIRIIENLAPVIGPDGIIYTAGYSYTGKNPQVYAINQNGTLKWTSNLGSVSVNDIGYISALSLRSDGVLMAVRLGEEGEVYNGFFAGVYSASSTVQAIDTATGAIIPTKSFPMSGTGVISFTDGRDGAYIYSDGQGITANDHYLTLGYYNSNSANKWNVRYPYNYNDGNSLYMFAVTTNSFMYNTILGDSRGWVYGSVSKETSDLTNMFTQYFALSPWTLSVNINADTVSPGSQLSFSALSSMKQVNPLFGGNNAMQVVLDTGEKIPLLYNGLDGRGSTVWTASYTIPTDYKLGDHSYTLEASQTYLVTDIPTHFAATTTESNNTGITRTGTFKVQQAGILFTSTGGTGNTTVQNTAEVLFVTGTSTATTTPTVVTNTNPTPTVPTSSPYSIQEPLTRTLRYRTWGTDVEHLQTILAKDPNIYPEGLVTGYFGTLTRSAVQAVQNRWNIVTSSDAGYGIFGPKTLAKVREQWGW